MEGCVSCGFDAYTCIRCQDPVAELKNGACTCPGNQKVKPNGYVQDGKLDSSKMEMTVENVAISFKVVKHVYLKLIVPHASTQMLEFRMDSVSVKLIPSSTVLGIVSVCQIIGKRKEVVCRENVMIRCPAVSSVEQITVFSVRMTHLSTC